MQDKGRAMAAEQSLTMQAQDRVSEEVFLWLLSWWEDEGVKAKINFLLTFLLDKIRLKLWCSCRVPTAGKLSARGEPHTKMHWSAPCNINIPHQERYKREKGGEPQYCRKYRPQAALQLHHGVTHHGVISLPVSRVFRIPVRAVTNHTGINKRVWNYNLSLSLEWSISW